MCSQISRIHLNDDFACDFLSAFNQMGYRLSPQFCQVVVRVYDTQAKQRLTLDNFIQVSWPSNQNI